MTVLPDHIASEMPALAPLDMPEQDFSAPHPRGRMVPVRRSSGVWLWRGAVFLPALVTTIVLLFGIHGWLANGGMSGLEYTLLALIGLTFVWVSLSVSTVSVGLLGLLRKRAPVEASSAPHDMSVALLMPIYNENPSDVFGNAAAMLDDLGQVAPNGRYSLFVLSDTRDDRIALQEEQAFDALKAGSRTPVFYRRRALNTDKKVGNLVDWIRHWGGAYDAMLVLDADSLMSAPAVERLATELAAHPSTGLIQSFPLLIGAETLFARLQQFSNVAYGWLLAEGLGLWAQSEGNYWGHNAIIRTRAFADSAGLPHLRGIKGQDQLIMSHDFVEAGLLRRAGWEVRFAPRMTGSFEETPSTLIDYVLRDRRWCQGNLQHLRLLGTRGFHPVSRFHLFHGAVSYLLSPAWFALLAIWAVLGTSADNNLITYFSPTNPTMPNWPVINQSSSLMFLAIMYAMLLTPKIAGAVIIAASRKTHKLFGGRPAFLAAFAVELVVSIAYAPVMMIQQTVAVGRYFIGIKDKWVPQRRGVSHYAWHVLVKFHCVETVLGALLVFGMAAGLVSLWLLPIAASLVCAVPLSALSAYDLTSRVSGGLRMDSPHTLKEPAIVRRAKDQRAKMRSVLQGWQMPAE